MASWIVHLRVAQEIYDSLWGLDEETFYVGNLAPDCGVPVGNSGTFAPPQKVTHFLSGEGKITADPERFYSEYIIGCNPKQRSFLMGYYCHLHTDLMWSRMVAVPVKDRFADELERNTKRFWKDVKKDWYGLDHDYLAQFPEFRGYKVICSVKNVDQSALDFFPDGAIIHQIENIRRFYAEGDFVGGRTGKYLTGSEMDQFVKIAASDIAERLKNLL